MVYAWQRADGLWYAGETVGLTARLKQHRRKHGKDLQMEYMLVAMEDGGKSTALVMEGHLIQLMVNAGFPMVSDYDSR